MGQALHRLSNARNPLDLVPETPEPFPHRFQQPAVVIGDKKPGFFRFGFTRSLVHQVANGAGDSYRCQAVD
jgi:hypothetical protein